MGFNLQIVTPDGLEFSGEVNSILARTDGGDVEILRGHADYFAAMGTGRIRLKIGSESKLASSSGGFISVTRGEVKLVVTTFEFAEEIDLDRAVLAKERAEATLAASKDDKIILMAKAKLARAINRINVAKATR